MPLRLLDAGSGARAVRAVFAKACGDPTAYIGHWSGLFIDTAAVLLNNDRAETQSFLTGDNYVRSAARWRKPGSAQCPDGGCSGVFGRNGNLHGPGAGQDQ